MVHLVKRGRNALFFYDRKHRNNRIYSLWKKRLNAKVEIQRI
jgi:hypothetical protein